MENFINGINKMTQYAGAMQGALDTLAPAVANLNASMTQMEQTVTGYPPPVYMPAYQPQTTTSNSFGADAFSTVGSVAAGGATAYRVARGATAGAGVASESLELGGILGKAKAFGMTAMKSTGLGALVGGGISAIVNTIRVVKGEETGREAVGNVAADTVGGGLSGIGGAAAGGLAVAALGGVLAGSVALPIIAVGAGLAGALGADFLYKASGLREWIRSKIAG